VLHSNGMHTVL